MILTSCATKL